MIAYLQGKDVTVEVPDDIGDKDLSDLNQHFDTLVKPETPEPAANSAPTTTGSGDVPNGPEAATPKPTWTPNFYESFIKPILPALPGIPALALQAGETPERRAFTGKAAEEFTFGATKPIADPMLSEDYKQHPVYANLGAMAGGVGSLLATGGALKAAGLTAKAAEVGAGAADVVAAAPRFLPRAIMTGATFGTQTFVKETVKAFQEGNVDLAAFGGHVLKNTALGATLGAISGLSSVPVSILSAGGLGFVSSKMDGGDNAEATLNGGIWAIFEAVGSYGRTAELRSEALKTLGDSIGEYVQNKDPNIAPEQAKAAGEAIVRQAAERVGGLDAVVKGEKGETLQLIEDINQQVRQGKIQEPIEAPKLLPGSETGDGEPTVSEGERGVLPGSNNPETPSQPLPPTGQSPLVPTESSTGEGGLHQVFQPTEVSSLPSIAEHPDFIKLTQDAEAVVKHYANLRGVEPTGELGMSLYREFHDRLGEIMRAEPQNRLETAKKLKAEFPDIENEFNTLKDKVFSDTTEGYFKRFASNGGQGSMRPKVALDAEQTRAKATKSAPLAPVPAGILYRGGSALEPGKITDLGISLSHSEEVAKTFADPSLVESPVVQQFKLKPDAKVLDVNDIPGWRRDVQGGFNDREIVDYARQHGFDAINISGRGTEQEIRVLNPAVLLSGKTGLPFFPAEKPVNLDDQGIPKLRPKAVVATVEDPDGKAVKITHEMVLEEAKGLKEAEKQTFQQANPLAQFVLDNGGVRGFKGGMESEEFKDVPLRFRGSKALDEMAQEAYNAGLLDEPNADLLRVELASVGKRAEPKPMAALYEQAKQNLSSFFSSTLPGEIPTQLEPGVAFSRAPGSSGDLINTQSENVADRYERVRQQALAQGMNPAQASAHAKNVLRGKPATAPEAAAPKPKQGEFGAEGGVQGFGQGRQGEGELNFSRSPGAKAEEPPVIKQVADHFKESATEIRDIVAPGKAAPLAERITRENLGKMARSYDMAEASLEEAGKLFDRQPKEVNLAFIDKMEHGQKQDDPQFEVIAKTLRNLLDSKRKEIQALGTGKLSAFIENYFPHIWDQGEKGVSQAIQKAAKRPLEGGKAFLKKRKIEFTNDGIEMGLTPVSYNPVDLTLLKIREMDKYLMAHHTLKEFKDTGLAKYVKIGGEVPEGWTKIDDKVSTVFKSPMIAVQEAYDEEMVNRLNAVAKSLGVELNRKTSLGRHKGMPAGVWGYSESQTPGQPGKVTTKFGGPESVIAHELGHQLDNIYGMQSRFLGAESEAEFSKLASLREGENADQDFKKYIQKPEERMAVMLESYIHAPQLFKETAPTLFKKFETFLDSRPELRPLTEIKPSLVMGQNESEVYAGGAVIAGHIWAHPDAARIINNYLSPGLQKSSVYRGYRAIGNFLNQAQLGFSFFHLGFTSVDAIVSKNALAAMELMNGNTKKAVLNLIRSPLSPIENIIRGDKLLQAWRGKGQSPVDEILAEAMASAGGRARMDQFYQTRAIEKMMENFKKFNFVRGALNIPMALTELTTRPILEAIVPRQKLGVFSDLMKSELENRPEMTHDEMRGVAQRVWDSVDNRMGQLVYDNLFWNRTFKDLLMASVRSVGWNLGTLREIGGGAVDFAKAPLDIIKGEKPKFTYRMAYVVALTFTVGVASAIYQYLRTGKGPQEPKDYVFPRTGRTDRNGDPDRVALPSYMKDIYHYGKHPLQTVLNKTSPLLNMLVEMYQNKDYYGTKIRNEDDPLIRQMMSEVEFVGKQLLPFSLRGTQQNLSAGNRSLADVIGPWIGVTPAPASINQTPAEELAHEIASSHVEIGGRTKDQVERAKMLSDLRRRFSSGDQSTMNDLTEAINKRQLSRAEALDVLKESKMTPLQRMAHSFSYDELQRVYKKGNEEEKAQLEPLLRQREISNIRQFGAATGRAPLP